MAARRTVRVYRDAAEFLADTGLWLLQRADHNDQIIAVAQLLTTTDHPFRDPIYLAGVTDGDGILGCALAAAPDGLEITEMPDDVVPSVVESIAQVRPDLSSVSGPRDSALHFARSWVQHSGGAWQLRHNWTLFRLDEVVAPRPAPGRLRLAEEGDWPWLSRCAPGYAQETNTPFDVAAFFRRRLRRRELYVWEHDGPKSVVAASGRTASSVRISAVYTPDARGRGYASNAVAGVSRMALEAGAEFCMLVADREPAQPARIYRALGYRPIRDHLVIDLLP